MEVQISWLAVVLATLSTMVVGSIWYTPAVFGTRWGKLAKVDMKRKMTTADTVKLFAPVVVAAFISSYVLAHVIYLSNSFFGNSWLQDALSTGFWVWLGFVAARMLTHELFENRPKQLFYINAAHELVTIMVMALIIGLIGFGGSSVSNYNSCVSEGGQVSQGIAPASCIYDGQYYYDGNY